MDKALKKGEFHVKKKRIVRTNRKRPSTAQKKIPTHFIHDYEEKIFLTPPAVAKILKVDRWDVYRWMEKDGLPYLRKGKQYVCTLADVRAWIHARSLLENRLEGIIDEETNVTMFQGISRTAIVSGEEETVREVEELDLNQFFTPVL